MRTAYHAALVLCLFGCDVASVLVEMDGGPDARTTEPFRCTAVGLSGCEGDVAVACVPDPPFVRQERTDCSLLGQSCVAGACQTCAPGTTGCFEGNPARCTDEGSWETTSSCDFEAGEACRQSRCVNLCEEALAERSYEGCEFFPVDLDTKGLYDPPFGIIVSNPNSFVVHVVLEVDEAEPGEPPRITVVAEADVPPFDLETFSLPRRRIDGRTEAGEFVETGSALTRRAYRVRARQPVIAYQFNPLAQADVFSNDASLLLPTSALGTRTTVIGWPQTIATRGMASQRSGDDYRSTLTVIGTADDTMVTVRFGPAVDRVLGIGAADSWGPGDTATFTLDAMDTLNLESDGFLADFTGSVVESSAPVAIYTGSEGADAPFYDTLSDRLCCADHLEDQLLPDASLGTAFVLARTPARGAAINLALTDPFLSLPAGDEYEIVRVLAPSPGTTRIYTGLDFPFDAFTLDEGEAATLVLDRDTTLVSDQPVSVIQVLVGQSAAGIPFTYQGGDPALVVVPPVAQYRTNYVFLTPSTYGFDDVTIVAPPDATVLLDDAPLPGTCESIELDDLEWVIHRCALSFPSVGGDFSVRSGVQGDGVHRIRSDRPVGVVVSGFDAFVSYAYAAGMNLEVLR